MKAMRKLLVGLLVLILMVTFVSCDDNKNVPDEITVSTWDGSSDTSWYSEGTEEYTLTEASQLAGLSKLVNDGTDDFSGVTITLANNIDLNDKQWTPIGHYDPVGEYETEKVIFSGTFDGQNHIITGLYFKDENRETVALFGYVNGTVKNFIVKGEITAKSGAGVIGGLEKGGTVENVTSYVDVVSDISDAKAKFGGIVLTLKAKLTTEGEYTIKGCKNYGRVASSSNNSGSIGGILGWTSDDSEKLTIEDCENHGEISATGTLAAGGIVGGCRAIKINGCTNDGKVSSAGSAAGGIVGYNDTTTVTLANCKNTGTVSGKENEAGGIAGRISGSLKDCTTTGTDVVLVGTLGAGEDENTISYSKETEITLPSVIRGNIALDNVKSDSLSLHYLKSNAHDLTVVLKNSAVTDLVVTMEQNESKSRLYLEKEGISSLGSLKFTGSFDRQNSNTHGELYVFANSVIEQKDITNELTFINRDASSADKDFGNASIYFVATGTSSSHADSTDTVIKSVMKYNSSSGEWERSTT